MISRYYLELLLMFFVNEDMRLAAEIERANIDEQNGLSPARSIARMTGALHELHRIQGILGKVFYEDLQRYEMQPWGDKYNVD